MSECIIPEHEESRKDNLVQHTCYSPPGNILYQKCTLSHANIFCYFVTSNYATNCVIHFRDSDVCDSNAKGSHFLPRHCVGCHASMPD